MHSRAKGPTKAERERMGRIVELGCVACRASGRPGAFAPEVQHLLDGGVRRGHGSTICLCCWHHRGVTLSGLSIAGMTNWAGPSLYHDARGFRARYGSDDELLAYQNRLLENA